MTEDANTDEDGATQEAVDPVQPEEVRLAGPVETKSTDAPMINGRFAICVVIAMVVLADFTLYKAYGYAGPAVFFALAPVLLCLGIPARSLRPGSLILWTLIAWLAYRLAANGNPALIISGFWLLAALVYSFRRQTPFVLETLVFTAECFPGGYDFFKRINDSLRARLLPPVEQGAPRPIVEILLPALSLLLFGGVFVMANPDMVNLVSGTLGDFADLCWDFAVRFSPFEVMFWAFVALLTGGLLRPVMRPLVSPALGGDRLAWGTEQTPLYAAFRNTLLALNCLFAVYLAFESRAFLSRVPPAGFTYSSYAHEGAAWLTVALGMATLTLSLIFRGLTLCDPRLSKLQTLAWVWTVLNLLLAFAVYNRMLIYIEYNGMTRMRVVALLGITSVVAGFGLVVLKLRRKRNFWWLVQRQLWVLSFAAYLFYVLPVDSIVHRYNVNQILAGQKAPVVQITYHEISDEALPELLPLCNVDDELISQGIQAMLSQRYSPLKQDLDENEAFGWSAWQKHQKMVVNALDREREQWDTSGSIADRQDRWNALKNFAFRTWW